MAENERAPDGLIDQHLSRIFGRSWRTSLLGLVAVACGLVPLIPGVPADVADTVGKVGAIVVGGGLLAAKDKSVSGQNKPGK